MNPASRHAARRERFAALLELEGGPGEGNALADLLDGHASVRADAVVPRFIAVTEDEGGGSTYLEADDNLDELARTVAAQIAETQFPWRPRRIVDLDGDRDLPFRVHVVIGA